MLENDVGKRCWKTLTLQENLETRLHRGACMYSAEGIEDAQAGKLIHPIGTALKAVAEVASAWAGAFTLAGSKTGSDLLVHLYETIRKQNGVGGEDGLRKCLV